MKGLKEILKTTLNHVFLNSRPGNVKIKEISPKGSVGI